MAAAESIRVLVVDDEPTAREIVAQLLRITGFEVLTTDTGEQGLVILRKWRERIHWLLTAVRLPGLVDGWILGDEFHASHPGRPVIYACAERLRASRTESSVFIRKPINPADVLTRVKRLSRSFDPAWPRLLTRTPAAKAGRRATDGLPLGIEKAE
jgi:two-component system, OmpR family, response regulator